MFLLRFLLLLLILPLPLFLPFFNKIWAQHWRHGSSFLLETICGHLDEPVGIHADHSIGSFMFSLIMQFLKQFPFFSNLVSVAKRPVFILKATHPIHSYSLTACRVGSFSIFFFNLLINIGMRVVTAFFQNHPPKSIHTKNHTTFWRYLRLSIR